MFIAPTCDFASFVTTTRWIETCVGLASEEKKKNTKKSVVLGVNKPIGRKSVIMELQNGSSSDSNCLPMSPSTGLSSSRNFASDVRLDAASRELYGIPEPPLGSRLTLNDIRDKLIRQEETIIFAFIERAQFLRNDVVYKAGSQGLSIPNFDGCFVDYLLFELEKVYATVRRYTSPDEYPFTPRDKLPAPLLEELQYPKTLMDNDINLNDRVMQVYKEEILQHICPPGDDENYGSSAVCDVKCLQSLSKRIHYGKFVAEAKFLQETAKYYELIKKRDRQLIWDALTDETVEAKLLARVEKKAMMIGQEINADGTAKVLSYKVEPSKVVDIYRDHIIPLTKEVQVQYLLQRA